MAADVLSLDHFFSFLATSACTISRQGHSNLIGTPGHAGTVSPRLDVPASEQSVQGYFTKGLPPSMIRTYKGVRELMAYSVSIICFIDFSKY